MRIEDLDRGRSPLGIRTVTLENAVLRLVLLPELGTKVYSIAQKPTGKEILWQNSGCPPRHCLFR